MSVMYRPRWMLKPTHDCNFNCKYCYDTELKQRYSGQVMELSVFEHVVQLAQKRGGEIVFHGGEPTLVGLDWYREAFRIIDSYNGREKGITLGMQTNGSLLNEEWFKAFSTYFTSIGISYDFHAQGEMRKDFAFQEMMKAAHKYNVRVGVISVITKRNVDHLWEMYVEAERLGISSCSFNPVFGTSSSSEAAIALLTHEDVKRGYGSFARKYLQLSEPKLYERVISDYISILRGLRPAGCNFSDCRGSYVCVMPDGRLFPCDHYLPDIYCFGNILDFQSVVEFIHTDGFSRFYRDTQKRNELFCKKCRYVSFCNGGCSGKHILAGPLTFPCNHLCNGVHAFFEMISEVIQDVVY